MLDDGGEVDLDLGNYERFLDVTLTRDNNITTGKIYREVIEKEARGPSTIILTGSGAAITWVKRCRWCRTLRTGFRTGSSASAKFPLTTAASSPTCALLRYVRVYLRMD